MIWCFHCDYGDRLRDRLRKRRATAGFSLVEILASILVVGICVGSAIASMASINRLAEVNRSLNYAVALCQERIAQTVASPFSPPAIVPSFFGTVWPVSGTDTVTSTETVLLYTNLNGGSPVTGTRTTLVSLANVALNLTRVTTRINYTYRGKDYVCETFTLRSPD